jgi:hypothetical protein
MAGVLWSDSPYGPFTFILITLVLGGDGYRWRARLSRHAREPDGHPIFLGV